MTLETIKLYLSNPWFWVYILPPFLVLILLPHIRKLYPKEMQKKIIECEISQKDDILTHSITLDAKPLSD